MQIKNDTADDSSKIEISLYELYALGIERLLMKAPWELERAVSAYHESFLTEQRCLALTILLLLGEDHVVPQHAEILPGFENQARFSVNQAVFTRALKQYFQTHKLNPLRADMVIGRMQSYITDSQAAIQSETHPLGVMIAILAKRVPPTDEARRTQYAQRVHKIYEYVVGLVEGSLLKRYKITP